MKNNENRNDDCAGRAQTPTAPLAIMNRQRVLRSVNEAYRQRFSATGEQSDGEAVIRGLEDGGTIYWKRKRGKVASFFRCLLR